MEFNFKITIDDRAVNLGRALLSRRVLGAVLFVGLLAIPLTVYAVQAKKSHTFIAGQPVFAS